MSQASEKIRLRERRKKRIRKKVFGTSERPRLSVFRSARHVYLQVVDDNLCTTLASVGTFKNDKRASKDVCTELGNALAAKCLAAHIEKVVFDKNGYAYHGRVKAVAEGAREGGLKF